MGQSNIINLNGRQYDAKTGALITESRIKATPEKRQAAQAQQHSTGAIIDGFVRGTSSAKPAAPKTQSIARTTTAKPAAMAQPSLKGKKFDVQRPQSQHVKPHQTERSKTLMRHVVPKPHATMKPAIKTAMPSEMAAKPVSDIAKQLEKKLSVTNVDPIRLSHAQHTPKSHHIKRFNQAQQHQPGTTAHKVSIGAHNTSPALPSAAVMSTLATAAPAPSSPSGDIFEAALARATSHEQTKPKASARQSASHRRLVSVLAGIAAFLVIGGFITYLNMPGIELRVASIKAGFHATMPAYQPTGYALNGGIESGENKVALSFRSGDSSYKVTQVASDWNSQTLLDSYTEQHGAPERTIQRNGRIIYMYDGAHATWVNGGIHYEVSGNAALSTEDVVNLATSM